jgi:two-component system, sensor histidine kinase
MVTGAALTMRSTATQAQNSFYREYVRSSLPYLILAGGLLAFGFLGAYLDAAVRLGEFGGQSQMLRICMIAAGVGYMLAAKFAPNFCIRHYRYLTILLFVGCYSIMALFIAPNPLPISWVARIVAVTILITFIASAVFRLGFREILGSLICINGLYLYKVLSSESPLSFLMPAYLYVFIASIGSFVICRQTERREFALFKEREAANLARTEAEDATRAMSYFLATASHDLRQPLTAMSLWTERLVRTTTSSDAAETAVEIQRSVVALREMFDSLMDLSKLDAGNVRIDLEAVDVAKLLNGLVAEYQDRATAKSLNLRAFVSEGICINSDRIQLTRLVRNLLHNAVNYTQTGGITVGANRLPDSTIEIYVEDSGPGIASDLQSRVFDEYFQVDNPARDKSKGLGLGLPIVRRLSQLLHLDVRLASNLGKGSRFSVTGEEALNAQPVQISPRATGPIRLDGALVLVVEDDPSIARALELLFSDAGARTLHADSLSTALAAMSSKPHAAIVDYRLKVNESGLEIAHALQEVNRDLPIIIQTGESEEQTMALLLRSPFPVLQKPVNKDELLSAIKVSI